MTPHRERRSRPPPSHVLVVDDDELWRELLCDCLSDAGHRVVSAADGREAMTVLATDHVQLVILDLEMPLVDGWQLRRWMLGQPKLAEVPAIVLSSHPPAVAPKPVAAVLQKPIRVDELLGLVARLT